MAGLTKAQRAAKLAAAAAVVTPEVEEIVAVDTKEEGVKCRYEFDSYNEYNKYIGKKG